MNPNYPSGVTSNEQTIDGYASQNYHSKSSTPRVAIIGTEASGNSGSSLFNEALSIMQSHDTEIEFIATNLDIPNHINYPPQDGFFFDP